MNRYIDLIEDLLQKTECEYLEFKHNNNNPEIIGKLCSALSNSSRLSNKPNGYCIWGICDDSKNIVGTSFDPENQKVGNQNFKIWLSNSLQSLPAIEFEEITHPDGRIVLLTVSAALKRPTKFKNIEYCRIGSSVTELSNQEKEHEKLISMLNNSDWEMNVAMEHISVQDTLSLLDFAKYFELLEQPIPNENIEILKNLEADELVTQSTNDCWNITNLGAILFGSDLKKFPIAINRKSIRLVVYKGKNKASDVIKRTDINEGYATGFESLIETLNKFIPENEHITDTLRTSEPLYPSIAVRELIANALIHQDFTITGAGPTIDLFDNRLEITNPGQSLIEPNRMIDLAPRSRNERLAALMRRLGFCEEAGSGIDKVINAIELYQSPPPYFKNNENAVQVHIHGPRKYADMTTDERIRACYQHATIKHLSGEMMKNETLRKRLGISEKSAAQASTVIKNTIEKGLIKSSDPKHPRSGYIPFWG